MSTRYDRKTTIAGVALTRARDLARSWHDSATVFDSAKKSTVGLHATTAMAVMDELLATGFLADRPTEVDKDQDRDAWQRERRLTGGRRFGPLMSESGLALLAASPMPPLHRDKAKPILDAVLANCEAINAPGVELPFRVGKAWLFGSMAKGAEHVNDIDLVVELQRTALWDIDRGPGSRRWIDMAYELGGDAALKGYGTWAINAIHYLERRLVYGARRHPRLAPNDVETLKNLACECSLVFDEALGGKVDGPLLVRHPSSTGLRADSVNPKLVLPDVAPVPTVRPIDMEFMDGSHRKVVDGNLWHYAPNEKFDQGWFRSEGTRRDGDKASDEVILMDDDGRQTRWSLIRTSKIENDTYRYAMELVRMPGRSSERAKTVIGNLMGALAAADVEKLAAHALATGSSMPLDASVSSPLPGRTAWKIADYATLSMMEELGPTTETAFGHFQPAWPTGPSVEVEPAPSPSL